jgi:beta-glucanase (GH16 family)
MAVGSGMTRWIQVLQRRRLLVIGGLAVLIVGILALEPSAIPTVISPQSSRLLFSDRFDGTALDRSNWNTYITSRQAKGHPWTDPRPAPDGSGGRNGCSFGAQYFLPSQVSVDHGLNLTASRTSTSGWCNQTDSVSTFAWRSGVVSTYNHFQFNGGYVSVTMKAPPGDGMWPGLWMLPGPGGHHGDDFEIDLQEGGFAPPTPASETYAWNLHQGSKTWGGTVKTGADLSSSYHTYGLDWIPGQSLTWYLDGKRMANLTRAQANIPDEPMELILDLAVANTTASGWHQPYDSTTTSPSTMHVSSVQVWSAPPS